MKSESFAPHERVILFQIENLKANVNYLHENIMECQQNIVQMEQAENPEEEGEEGITKVVNFKVNFTTGSPPNFDNHKFRPKKYPKRRLV